MPTREFRHSIVNAREPQPVGWIRRHILHVLAARCPRTPLCQKLLLQFSNFSSINNLNFQFTFHEYLVLPFRPSCIKHDFSAHFFGIILSHYVTYLIFHGQTYSSHWRLLFVTPCKEATLLSHYTRAPASLAFTYKDFAGSPPAWVY